MEENDYLLGLSTYPLLGSVRLKLLYDFFGSYEKIWLARRGDLMNVNLGEKLVDGLIRARDDFNLEAYRNRLKDGKINFITPESDRFPKNIRYLPDSPLYLYVKGQLKDSDVKSVAVVGTRKPTVYGIKVATDFVSDLVKENITIVSGLAYGIDTVASREAIKNGGRTIVVLGSGIDIIYPKENELLSEKILANGAIISEYPLGYPPKRENFPERNRIVSGISKGVLVVEGEEKSGTLITANRAVNQGKEVFAIPGSVYSKMSKASFFLIQNGAKLCSSPQEIIKFLNT